MASTGKDNKVLWNIETTLLNETAYELYLKEVDKLNFQLFLKQEDKRCSYTTLDDFICHKKFHKEYTDKALIILRLHKINKLKNH
jgi:hypothetical protein